MHDRTQLPLSSLAATNQASGWWLYWWLYTARLPTSGQMLTAIIKRAEDIIVIVKITPETRNKERKDGEGGRGTDGWMDAHITHAPPKPQLPQIARFSTVVASILLSKLCEGARYGILIQSLDVRVCKIFWKIARLESSIFVSDPDMPWLILLLILATPKKESLVNTAPIQVLP